MKELDFVNIILQESGREYIGDDCAYLQDAGIVVSQDNLAEGIHFKREWYTPFQLGYKSAAVNISDVLASGATPEYLTIGLSLTNDIDEAFIKEFYRGVNSVDKNVKVVGGDITGSKNGLFISVTAIGKTAGRNISSRKNAEQGYAVITKGMFGSSAAGLEQLMTGGNNKELILTHLMPTLEFDFSESIAAQVKAPYAMMDSSDGLADALYRIAEASGVSVEADYDLIPHLDSVTKEQVLFGGEDYKLIACVPKDCLKNIPDYVQIGEVHEYNGTMVKIGDLVINKYDDVKSYNHFQV